MRFLYIAGILALACAVPTLSPHESIVKSLDGRRIQTVRNELESGTTCPGTIFIWARATTEPGNMGLSLGPIIADKLEDAFGEEGVWVQGVGGPYTATSLPNLYPDGTTSAAIGEMIRLVELAHAKCPNAKIVCGRYSQGTAVTAGAIRDLSETVRKSIAGSVLFGYVRNLQNKGGIPNFPSEKLKVFCDIGDLVCDGIGIVAPGHFSYTDDAQGPASQFLISLLKNDDT